MAGKVETTLVRGVNRGDEITYVGVKLWARLVADAVAAGKKRVPHDVLSLTSMKYPGMVDLVLEGAAVSDERLQELKAFSSEKIAEFRGGARL